MSNIFHVKMKNRPHNFFLISLANEHTQLFTFLFMGILKNVTSVLFRMSVYPVCHNISILPQVSNRQHHSPDWWKSRNRDLYRHE